MSSASARILNIRFSSETPPRRVAAVGAREKRSTEARRMASLAEGNRFSVVREFVGHGIGTRMHEDPQVPNYYDGPKKRLRPGLVNYLLPKLEQSLYELSKLDKLHGILDQLLTENPGDAQVRLAQARFESKRQPESVSSAQDAAPSTIWRQRTTPRCSPPFAATSAGNTTGTIGCWAPTSPRRHSRTRRVGRSAGSNALS